METSALGLQRLLVQLCWIYCNYGKTFGTTGRMIGLTEETTTSNMPAPCVSKQRTLEICSPLEYLLKWIELFTTTNPANSFHKHQKLDPNEALGTLAKQKQHHHCTWSFQLNPVEPDFFSFKKPGLELNIADRNPERPMWVRLKTNKNNKSPKSEKHVISSCQKTLFTANFKKRVKPKRRPRREIFQPEAFRGSLQVTVQWQASCALRSPSQKSKEPQWQMDGMLANGFQIRKKHAFCILYRGFIYLVCSQTTCGSKAIIFNKIKSEWFRNKQLEAYLVQCCVGSLKTKLGLAELRS